MTADCNDDTFSFEIDRNDGWYEITIQSGFPNSDHETATATPLYQNTYRWSEEYGQVFLNEDGCLWHRGKENHDFLRRCVLSHALIEIFRVSHNQETNLFLAFFFSLFDLLSPIEGPDVALPFS